MTNPVAVYSASHTTVLPRDLYNELLEDQKRLDFLEMNRATLNTTEGPKGPHVAVQVGPTDRSHKDVIHFYGKTYRDAVDQAMAVIK